MDYFTQLLESYEDIKKRKFKIIYEQTQVFTRNEPRFVSAAQQLAKKTGQDVNTITSELNRAYSELESGGAKESVANIGGLTIPLRVTGKGITLFTKDAGMYTDFKLGVLEKGSELSPEEEALGSPEYAQGAMFPGELVDPLESAIPADWTEEARNSLFSIRDELNSICDKLVGNYKDPLLCTHIDDFVGLHKSNSIVSKLLKAVTKIRDDQTGLEIGVIEDTIDPGLVEDVLSTIEELTKMVSSPDISICNKLNNRVSFDSKMITILSKTGEEGLVIPARDRFFKMLKKSIPAKACDANSFRTALFKKRIGKSNLFGKFNEHLAEFGINLLLGNDKTKFLAKKKLVKAITESSDNLTAVLQEYDRNKGSTYNVETYVDLLDNLELAGIIKTKALQKYIAPRIAGIQKALVEVIGEVKTNGNYISVAGTARQGAREDGLILFSDEKEANIVSNKIVGENAYKTTPLDLFLEYGAEIGESLKEHGFDKQSKEPIFIVGLGVKAYDKNPKLGEVNKYSRLTELLTNSTSPDDAFIKKPFLNQVDKKLDIDKPKFNKYINDIMSNVEDRVGWVLNGSSFRNDKGELTSMTPEQIIKLMQNRISKDMGYTQRLESALAGFIGGPDEKINLEVPENEERLSDLIRRHTLIHVMHRDLAGPDKEKSAMARQALLKMLFVSGGNYNPMGQLTVTDNGSKLFNHTKIQDDLIRDMNNGKGEIIFEGSKSSIKFRTGEGEQMSLNFEATWIGGSREGRLVARYNGNKSKKVKESKVSSFTKYLQNQKVLIEEFLKELG